MGKGIHLYQMSCWGSSTCWYTNDINNLCGKSSKWYTPMRILGVSIEEYIDLLINKFNAKSIKYYAPTDCLTFHFLSEKEAKAFCLYVNRQARKLQYYCA